MQSLSAVKLNLYEQIGYLMTGAVAVTLVLWDFQLADAAKAFPQIDLGQSVLVFIGAYVAGHFAQVLSNYVVPYPKKSFSNLEKQILKRVREYLSLTCSDDETMGFTMMLAQTSDTTGQVGAFNANYGLYRGWSVIFLCQAIVMAVISVLHPSVWSAPWGQIELECMAEASAAVSWLFLKRAMRFNRYYRSKVFQTATIKLATEDH